jgi:cytochrome b6-f complex iron-sulfur subunit
MGCLGDVCATRRTIIAALPGLALLPGVVAACSPSASPPVATQVSSPPVVPPADAPKHVQVQQSKVPIGTAIIVAGRPPWVVAQPTAGHFVAFSAVCTHRGTTLLAGDGTTLVCPSHGSEFDAATGAVLNGPADRPLASVPVAATNGLLTIG